MFEMAKESWRAAWQACLRLPKLFGSALILLMALDVMILATGDRLGVPSPHDIITTGMHHPMPLLPIYLFSIGAAAVETIVLAPLAIGVHRLILLGEASDDIAIASDPRAWRFALWLIALNLLRQFPTLFKVATSSQLGGGISGLIQFALVIVTAIAGVRLVLLFPATAIDQTHPAAYGWRLSRSHAWRIFFTMLVTLIPTALVGIPTIILGLGGFSSADFRFERPLSVMLGGVTQVATVALLAAVASGFYRVYTSEHGPGDARLAA